MLPNQLAFHSVVLLQILISKSAKGSKRVNIALHKPATQSSLSLSRVAGLAVDGIAVSNYFKHPCTHTNVSSDYREAWWEVDLQAQYRIVSIRILNRLTCDERLHDVSVDVFADSHEGRAGKHCNTHTGQAGRGWLIMACKNPVTGRYVRITKPQNAYDDVLTLCEVEIYGAQDFRFEYFGRIGMTRKLASGKGMTARSNIDCSAICVLKADCTGFSVSAKEVGKLECVILSERPKKGENSVEGNATTYIILSA